MHTKLIATLLVGLLMGTAVAEEFYLKHDRTGKVYGPFQTEAGAKVKMGSATFTVVQKKAAAPTLEKTLSDVRLKQIDLRSAALADSIKFLEMQIQHQLERGKVVNFVLVNPPTQDEVNAADPFAFPPGGRLRHEARITLELRDVSALDVLKLMMEQTGATYKTSGNTVTIYPKK